MIYGVHYIIRSESIEISRSPLLRVDNMLLHLTPHWSTIQSSSSIQPLSNVVPRRFSYTRDRDNYNDFTKNKTNFDAKESSLASHNSRKKARCFRRNREKGDSIASRTVIIIKKKRFEKMLFYLLVTICCNRREVNAIRIKCNIK